MKFSSKFFIRTKKKMKETILLPIDPFKF